MVQCSKPIPAKGRWLFAIVIIVVFTCVFVMTRSRVMTRKPLFQENAKPPEITSVYRVEWRRTHRIFLPQNISTNEEASLVRARYEATFVHVAIVVCGKRFEESLVMLKSAVIFSRTNLVFHIVTEDNLRQPILKEFESWPSFHKERLNVNLYRIQFPESPSCPECVLADWKNLFAPCAAQRLFFPYILSDVDSVIYVDTDTLFLSPLENMWFHFYNFTPNQIFGIMPEMSGWYSDKKFPYCTETGANSGVLLMNLTRIRQVKWIVKLNKYFTVYRGNLTLWDQDLLNLYCSFHPGHVYVMSCLWNYRKIFCPSERACSEGEREGAYILHGNSKAFHINNSPTREVYLAVKEHHLESDNLQVLLDRIKTRLRKHSKTECGKRPQIFTRQLEKYIASTALT